MNETQTVRHEPRGGLAGFVDRLAGPGATTAELALQFGVAFAAAGAAAVWYAISQGGSPWLVALAAVLGFDLGGGVVTNATAAAKRWFHRPGQGFADHFGFVLLHIVHIALISFIVLGISWRYFAGASIVLVAGALLILLTPRRLTRPVAMAVYALVLVSHRGFLPVPLGFEWFTPVFFLKLFVCHLVPEGGDR